MQPCDHIGCPKWIAYGSYCADHEPTPVVKATVKPKGTLHPIREDRRNPRYRCNRSSRIPCVPASHLSSRGVTSGVVLRL